MSDRAVDDLNARLVQQRTAFEDKQVNTRTIPAFLALSLFKNHRLCHCPSDCLSSPARRDVVHDRGRSRHQVPRTRGPRPKPPATQVGARPRRRRGRERAQASTEARGALLRRGTPPRLQITHFSVDAHPFAHHAMYLDHLITHAMHLDRLITHSRRRTRPHLRRSASQRYSPQRNPRCARFLVTTRPSRARALPFATPFARCGSSPVGS